MPKITFIKTRYKILSEAKNALVLQLLCVIFLCVYQFFRVQILGHKFHPATRLDIAFYWYFSSFFSILDMFSKRNENYRQIDNTR